MTLVAAVCEDSRVVMVADRLGSDGDDPYYLADPKIWRCGPFLVGAAGQGRFCQVLQVFVPWATLADDLERDPDGRPHLTLLGMVRVVVPAVRAACLEHDAIRRDEAQNVNLGGNALVALGNRVYAITHDQDVVREVTPYAAIGSGSYSAMGSLHTTEHLRDNNGLKMRAADRLLLAARAAAAGSLGVSGPFDFYDTLGDAALRADIDPDRAWFFPHGTSDSP